ncbi:MAG: hypothetical protein AB1598_05335 [Thermodesulfobacteriota bacterium]
MTKTLISILFAVTLFPAAVHSPEPGPGEHSFIVQQYRCEIINGYIYLRKITDKFGEILLSENYEDIFPASIAVIASLDEMKNELESTDVPASMREAHDVFLKSVDSYRQGADLVRIAVGTYLGKYERKGNDIQELIDQSVRRVTMANNYLGQSLALHGSLLGTYEEGSGECKKVVAFNY